MAKKRLPVWSLDEIQSKIDELVKVLTELTPEQNDGLLDTESIVESVAVINHSLMQLNFPNLSESELVTVRSIKSKLSELSTAYSEHKQKVELTIRSQQNASKLRKAYG